MGPLALVEDGEQELDPDIADLFDREANVFATELLFQLENPPAWRARPSGERSAAR